MKLNNALSLSPQEINQLKKELFPKPANTVLANRFNPKHNNSGHAAGCSGVCRSGSCMGSM